jgi:hypothetical protein
VRKLAFAITTGLISLLALGAGTGRAQSEHKSNAKPKASTPFELARAVNESKRMWDQNHTQVLVDLGFTWNRLGIDPGPFAGCSGDCEAKIYRHELDSTPGKEIILKLMQSYNFCRYLIFARARTNSRARSKWKLLGYIDHDFNRYKMSSHRIVRASGTNWLVIRGQEGSGSGFSLYGETWYQVSDKGVRATLSYPFAGNTDPWPIGLGRQFKARVFISRNSIRRSNEILIRYRVTYSTLDYIKNDFKKLFANEHHAYYGWSKRSHTFVFDRKRSDITEDEINAIAGIETEDEPQGGQQVGSMTFYTQSETRAFVGGGYEVFLKYNSHRLMKIAMSKNAEQKQWLKQFLEDCENTAEKKALLQVLPKQ